MSEAVKKPTNCHFCGYLCAFEATVVDGRITDLEPDTTRYPYDDSIVKGCRRWHENIRFLDDPGRINHPLRRKGRRGSGEWEEVSWNEALDDIASRLSDLADRYGPRTLASAIGGPHATFWPLHRFLNLYGSPNNMGIGTICWNPRIWMDAITFGWTIEADIRPGITEAFLIWGTNPAQSDNSMFWREIIHLSNTDMPIVVIDPRLTQTAARADIWLSPRPGTDGFLALGLAHVIIEEGLEDRDFIDRWCHGYDEYLECIEPYSAEAVASICDVPEDDIRRVARLLGSARSAVIVTGRGIDQVGENVAPTHRAIACLRAITGNVDNPGGCNISTRSSFTPEVDLELGSLFPDDLRAECLNTPYTPLQSYEGYRAVRELTLKHGNVLPERYLTSAHPSLVWRAAVTGEPYPVRALIVQATNPLITYADTQLVFEALSMMELIVVLEYQMTSTAMMADYVLPIASAMERPLFQIHGGVADLGYGGPAAVQPAYERRCDYSVFRELGIRLGQGGHWPDETLEDAYDRQLRDAGTDWEEFCRVGVIAGRLEFGKHERIDPRTGEPHGFATTSGKVELASEILGKLGGDRVPVMSLPEEPGEGGERGELPLIALTGSRKQPYNGSDFHDFESFRKIYPKPLASVSAEVAGWLDASEGDRVTVRTEKGHSWFYLHIDEMRNDIVDIDYGWWWPERNTAADGLGGIWDSNVNTITSCDIESGEPMIGTWKYNGFPCTISKGWKE